MISALDHVALSVAAPTDAAREYAALLGCMPDTSLGRDNAGIRFQLANCALCIKQAVAGADGLSALTFAVPDVARYLRLLQRRALDVTASADSGELREDTTRGFALGFVERRARPAGSVAASAETPAISGIDHVVIRTTDPQRALAFYGARLGLDLRLDIARQDWGMRLLFFRCGDTVVEVAHALKEGTGLGCDRLWGISWRVRDIDAAHARLHAAGIELSPVRAGRRQNTKVFSVRSGTCGVPTLIIAKEAGLQKDGPVQGEKTRGD